MIITISHITFYISAKIYQHYEGDQSKGYWNQDTQEENTWNSTEVKELHNDLSS